MARKSILPKIAVTRTDEGTMLVIERVGAKEILFVLLFAAGAALNGWVATREDLEVGQRIMSVAYAVIMVALAIATERHYRNRRRLRGATLTLNRWPLRLGEEVKAVFRSAPASPVKASLICVESAVKGGGKWSKHELRVLYSIDLEGSEWAFMIPDELPPSFEAKDNKIQWRVEAAILLHDVEVPLTYNLLVIPEVAG